MKMIAASPPPAVPLAEPATRLSRLGRWRWNVLAALFAALVLVALVVRRWRCAEIDDGVDASARASPPRIGVALLLVTATVAAGLLFFPLVGGELAAMPALAGSDAVIDPAPPAVALVAVGDLGDAGADARCAQCAVVASTREIVADWHGAATGVEVTVRTKDGASHLFTAAKSANSPYSAHWRAGERVIFIAGRNLGGD